jgi:phage terminase large subunit-like protein
MKSEPLLLQTIRKGEWTERHKKTRLFALLVERIRRQARDSLYYHCKYVLGYQDIRIEPHWDLCQWIQRHLWEDMLVLLPRGTFKSTILSVGLPTWLFPKCPDLRILLDSYELANTRGWLGVARRTFESSRLYRMVYGDFANTSNTKGEPWHSTALALKGRAVVRAENSLTATSLQTSETSQHHDIYIGDDLQTEDNVCSREMIETVGARLEQVLAILDPWERKLYGRTSVLRKKARRGPRIVVGTHWSFDDAYYRLRREEDQRRREHQSPQWRMYIRKAVWKDDDTGKMTYFFPSRFSKEHLEELRANMSTYLWSCNYLNDPMPDEAVTFKISDLGFFTDEFRVMDGKIYPMQSRRTCFLLLDPSISDSDRSDWCAFVVASLDSDWNIFIETVYRDRIVGNEEILSLLFEFWKEWSPAKTGIEDVCFQKSLLPGFKKLCRDRGVRFKVYGLTPSNRRSKPMRIRGFEPFVAGGKVHLRVAEKTDLTQSPKDLYFALVKDQDALAEEMQRFPVGATDDCLDALAYLPELAFPAKAAPKPEPVQDPFVGLLPLLKKRRGRNLLLTVR